jgi:hypothetical protein
MSRLTLVDGWPLYVTPNSWLAGQRRLEAIGEIGSQL